MVEDPQFTLGIFDGVESFDDAKKVEDYIENEATSRVFEYRDVVPLIGENQPFGAESDKVFVIPVKAPGVSCQGTPSKTPVEEFAKIKKEGGFDVTGFNYPPHLHFMLTHDTRNFEDHMVNPIKILRPPGSDAAKTTKPTIRPLAVFRFEDSQTLSTSFTSPILLVPDDASVNQPYKVKVEVKTSF